MREFFADSLSYVKAPETFKISQKTEKFWLIKEGRPTRRAPYADLNTCPSRRTFQFLSRLGRAEAAARGFVKSALRHRGLII